MRKYLCITKEMINFASEIRNKNDFKQLNRLRFKPTQKRAKPVFRSGDV